MTNEFFISKLVWPHVLPPLPPFPESNTPSIKQAGQINGNVVEAAAGDKIEQTIFGTPQVMPLKMKLKTESDYWLLPVEPMISIDGKNILIKRNVAKRKKGYGSIKEYWTQDDWTINVQGLLTNPGSEDFPANAQKQLIKYLTAQEPLDVLCPGFERLSISKIVIESYSLPFTKGPENQNYSFVAYSDNEWSLLLKRKVTVNAL